ncbi:MAG: hypothetical protein RL076_2021 [Chloroflexota bacterium]
MFYSISSCSVWMSLSKHLNSLVFSFTRLMICIPSQFSYHKSLAVYPHSLYHPLYPFHLCPLISSSPSMFACPSHFSYHKFLAVYPYSLYHPLNPFHLCSLIPSSPSFPSMFAYTILSIYVRLYHPLHPFHLCSLIPSSPSMFACPFFLSFPVNNQHRHCSPCYRCQKVQPRLIPKQHP